ncbi:Transcription-repair-coupling factor, partial [Haemophilus influenzae]
PATIFTTQCASD